MTDAFPSSHVRSVCPWAAGDPIYLAYHDDEWGVPTHDDQVLFEYLVLEAMQAGLSWITILRRREAFRAAFDGFDPEAVSRFDAARVDAMMENPGIIRNRRKLEASVRNAAAFLAVQREFGSFDRYLWSFAPAGPLIGRWPSASDIPASTPLAERLSADLRRRGFSFAGPTICYAFMQASGLVNDHIAACDCAPPASSEMEETP